MPMKSCDSCQQQPATNHVTMIIEGVTKITDLCSECFERAGPPEAKAFAAAAKAAKSATCCYCGGQPCWEATDIFGSLTGNRRDRFMCLPCQTEFYRVAKVRLDRSDEALATREEFFAAVRVNGRRVDKHMREWIANRKQ
jgi:protein-arginine kinase activator protein McsA